VNLLKSLLGIWFTGFLLCLAGIGYLFYGIMVIFRMIQTQKIVAALCVTGIVLCSLGIGAYLFLPLQQPGDAIEILVEPGTSIGYVARQLRLHEVIPSSRAFLLWVKFKGLDRKMQSGIHSFYKFEGIISASRRLQEARPVEKSITIPEGLIIDQVAAKAAEVFGIDSAEFVRICNDSVFISQQGLDVPSLEGYLFPESYRFPPETGAQEIIVAMIRQFRKVYDAIPQTELSRKFTCHEIVTLASIVEKEATLREEQTRIAGVFHNRLRIHTPLGADPTVRYVLRKFSGPLRVSELQNPSPYNTRIHAGLPPGPICSPGAGALAAAIAPMNTKELYFVAKWDGSGAHDFSVTNAQHDRKKIEIRLRNDQRKLIKKK
jgi:UPF0755 protein